MKLHRIKAGHYTARVNGVFYSIIHTLHWDIYYGGELGIYVFSAHTLTDARALLEEIIKGGLPI